MEKAYRYRFYPTPEQEWLLRRTLGCVRLVYNRALAARTEGWYERQERIGYSQTSSMLTAWKQQEDLQFLNEVSCVPHDRDMNAAKNILAVGHTVSVCGATVRPEGSKSRKAGARKQKPKL